MAEQHLNQGRERLRRSMRSMYARRTRKDDPDAITAPSDLTREDKERVRGYYQRRGHLWDHWSDEA